MHLRTLSLCLIVLLCAYASDATFKIACPKTLRATHTGGSVTVNTTITSSTTVRDAIVSFELYNAQQRKVSDVFVSHVLFTKNRPHHVKTTLHVAATEPAGAHWIKVLVFTANWATVLASKSSCSSLSVLRAAPPPSKPPAPPPSPVPGAPSGVPAPVGDLPGWTQVFREEFAVEAPVGGFLSTYKNFGAYEDGWFDTTHHGQYYPSRVLSASGGKLRYFMHTEGGIRMVSAPYPLIPGATAQNGMLYGRYVVRMRVDPLAHYKTAFLLWPDSENWPAEGEIDFPEANLDQTVAGYVHRFGATSGSDQDAYESGVRYASGWHTYEIQWLPGKIVFSIDGNAHTITDSRVPSKPMHYVMQAETSLDGVIPDISVQGYIEVDWVVVYKPTPSLLSAHAVTATSSSTSDSSSSSSASIPAWSVVLVVIGAVLVCAALVALIFVIVQRRRQEAETSSLTQHLIVS